MANIVHIVYPQKRYEKKTKKKKHKINKKIAVLNTVRRGEHNGRFSIHLGLW